MADLVLTTFDWVPEAPRGYVRDLRVRWALEEADLPYRVESVPFGTRTAEHQPFGQVPWLTDGDMSIFESGAILLYLGERSGRLIPADPRGRAATLEWLFAALNSVEMPERALVLVPVRPRQCRHPAVTPGRKHLEEFLHSRLRHMQRVLAEREWLAGTFTIADIVMADVLRLVDRFDGLAGYPACREYVARATARPAFVKAHADQIAHFAAAD